MNSNHQIRIIVAGSRTFNDYVLLSKVVQRVLLFELEKFNVLSDIENLYSDKVLFVSGHAKGGDDLGERFASEHGYNCHIMEADWERFGKRAGFLRNEEMANLQ